MVSRGVILFAFCVLPLACSSGTNMSGGGKEKDEIQKRKSAREAVAETPTVTTEETEGEGDLDEDLKVIPPEVVSGAYLTCASEERESGESGEGGGSVLYGCNVFDDNDQRVDLEDLRPQWRLFAGGEVILAPETQDERYHKAWTIAAEIAAKGLSAEADVKGKQGEVVIERDLEKEAEKEAEKEVEKAEPGTLTIDGERQ